MHCGGHPRRVELPTGHHLRPIHPDDVDLDMPAVMGSRDRLWSIYGEAWGWPPAMPQADRDELMDLLACKYGLRAQAIH